MLKTITAFLALTLAGALLAEEPPTSAKERARAELIEHIRDRILWHDEARTQLFLIPVEIFDLLPIEDLPIPEESKTTLRAQISIRLHWRSPTGGEYGDCEPVSASTETPESEKESLRAVINEAAVAVVVEVEKVVTVWGPNMGTRLYCEVKVLQFLHGENFSEHVKKTRSFLVAAGEFTIEGARICTMGSKHTKLPEVGDSYLLLGAPDETGMFQPRAYFPVVGGYPHERDDEPGRDVSHRPQTLQARPAYQRSRAGLQRQDAGCRPATSL